MDKRTYEPKRLFLSEGINRAIYWLKWFCDNRRYAFCDMNKQPWRISLQPITENECL